MWAWLSGLLANIVKDVVGLFVDDYNRKKLQADKTAAEWEARTRAGQLESVKEAGRIQDAIASRPPPVLPDATDAELIDKWNKGAKIVVLLVSLTLIIVNTSGCIVTRYVYVEQKMPLIEKPKRPLITDPAPLTPRERSIVVYSLTLDDRIDAYNDEAKKHNIKNGF